MSNTMYMEKDGAVVIPERLQKMNHSEIVAECARLERKLNSEKAAVKKQKPVCKTKFVI